MTFLDATVSLVFGFESQRVRLLHPFTSFFDVIASLDEFGVMREN